MGVNAQTEPQDTQKTSAQDEQTQEKTVTLTVSEYKKLVRISSKKENILTEMVNAINQITKFPTKESNLDNAIGHLQLIKKLINPPID